MLTIWKYGIPGDEYFDLELPIGAKPLAVQNQGGKPQMWVLLDKDEMQLEYRTFRILGTGWDIAKDDFKRLDYIGTFQMQNGLFIWHVFEIQKDCIEN